MALKTLLVANRGEIAIRVMRAASEMGMRCVGIYSSDDADSLHTRKADECVQLDGTGAAAYLDIEQIVQVAVDTGCDAVHPGYGFLSENADFARCCAEAGVRFVGPSPEVLELFGDKTAARALAERVDVPILRGTKGGITVDEAAEFFETLGSGSAMIIKAIAGGGGRGARIVTIADEVADAFTRCESEAKAAFGNGSLFAEELLPGARHVEVQVIGDVHGNVSHLWERECSIQRRHQKLIEVAPSPGISAELRERLTDDAVRIAREAGYVGVGTVEFLVSTAGDGTDGGDQYVFIETNPRLQVEHTVTEEVLGVDVVLAQLGVAAGESLAELGLDQATVPRPRGYAIQARVNMETMTPEGVAQPAGGVLTAFEVPSGHGFRTDSFGYVGYRTSARFDSLLAKVIVHTPSTTFADAVAKAQRALAEFRVEGVPTNIEFLQDVLSHPDVRSGQMHTRFVDEHMAELAGAPTEHRRLYVTAAAASDIATAAVAPAGSIAGARLAGTRVDSSDPLAVLSLGKSRTEGAAAVSTGGQGGAATTHADAAEGPDGASAVPAPMQGTVVEIDVAEGDAVHVGQQIAVMEAMKMEHVVASTVSGYVRMIGVSPGDAVFDGHPLVFVEPSDEVAATDSTIEEEVDLDEIRSDLQEILDRHAVTLDDARPEAVAKRHKRGQRTARENVEDLCDDDTFVEHGQLVLTPGSGLPMDDVIRKFPGDGMVCGVGNVNGELFGPDSSRTVVLAYDYTVLAGTQGPLNHPKTDRMLEMARDWRLPVVFFTEGGGGRAGTGGDRTGKKEDKSQNWLSRPLVTSTFTSMARLNGVVPTIGINSGYCFAGNAALLGACDVIIATENSNIGMGGPAMIEGGGLGVFSPEEVGPIDVQLASGVVDIAVKDEAEGVEVAKKYLSYFQGPLPEWECDDQRKLRTLVPANRLRTYDIRKVIETLADRGSVLELRTHFGHGMVTAHARVEGRTVGILANNPEHLAGAIDSDGSDKAARFMQLCDAFDIPLVVLCDTPGIMVGPEIEKTGLVRHCNRLFIAGANLSIPMFMVVVRKAVGLGALAMGGGNVAEPVFTVAWPTGEFSGMGLEGQIKLGYRNELEAITDPAKRLARYEKLVAMAYERSKALHQGVMFGVDDVIDPMDTRRWIANGLRSVANRKRSETANRRVDTW